MIDREILEQQALETVSADLYYDLADNIDSATDHELIDIINCNGDYRKEMELWVQENTIH
jgi:hypothetical protein